MSKNNQKTWKTKYGPRRVRVDAPTLQEAITAAQGLSDNIDEQAEIAASLMGCSPDEARVELSKLAPPRRDIIKTVAFTGPASAPRTVVVERKPSRRIVVPAGGVRAGLR